jgi:CheY-like chemotaxis protein
MNQMALNILLVEDNYGDERLVREALDESKRGAILNVVRDGVDALSYLRKGEGHADALRPDIIFLDMNIPKKSGLQVLAEIRGEPELTTIPVLMLTTSDSLKEKSRCIELKANEYIRKPVDLNDFLRLIQNVERQWADRISEPKET